MAKINPIFGKLTGKIGGTVFAIRNGEQIIREYNPAPFNPRSVDQVAARARLKMMSQLSAVMAPVIAIPRQGNVSSRNMFVKTNYDSSTYANHTADIELTNIKLTKSVVSLAGLTASRTTGNKVSVSVLAGGKISRVVVVAFAKLPDGTLSLSETKVLSTTTEGGAFEGEVSVYRSYEGVVYAYGVRDNTDSARAKFGNLQALTAETVAKLIVSRTLTEADITLTETKAVVVTPASAQTAVSPSPEDKENHDAKSSRVSGK